MRLLATSPISKYIANSGNMQCQFAPDFSVYKGLSLMVHIARRFTLVGSPKTAAPVCVLTLLPANVFDCRIAAPFAAKNVDAQPR